MCRGRKTNQDLVIESPNTVVLPYTATIFNKISQDICKTEILKLLFQHLEMWFNDSESSLECYQLTTCLEYNLTTRIVVCLSSDSYLNASYSKFD